jgi:hypothetical protein
MAKQVAKQVVPKHKKAATSPPIRPKVKPGSKPSAMDLDQAFKMLVQMRKARADRAASLQNLKEKDDLMRQQSAKDILASYSIRVP